jgi:hypothetical protein
VHHEEPFGTLPGELPPQPPDELLDPRLGGTVLPVQPPTSAHHIPSRYRRSAGASMIAAGLIGLRDVIDPAKGDDGTVIEQQVDDVDTARSVEVYLDPDDPASSVVVIRDPADLN